MKYTEILKAAVVEVNELWKSQGENMSAEYVEVTKNNDVTIEGICLKLENGLAPTIYFGESNIDIASGDTERLADYLKERIDCAKVDTNGEQLKDLDYVVRNVRPVLVNSCNKETFDREGILYRHFNDLLIVFRVYLEVKEGLWGSTLVKKSFLDMWNCEPQDIIRNAEANISWLPFKTHHDKLVVTKMSDLLGELLGASSNDEDIFSLIADDFKLPMWVISNEERQFGAAMVLGDGNREEILRQTGCGDLILIPSSVHEWIAVPKAFAPAVDLLSEMIKEVNGSQVEPTEVLSDHPYILLNDTAELWIYGSEVPF